MMNYVRFILFIMIDADTAYLFSKTIILIVLGLFYSLLVSQIVVEFKTNAIKSNIMSKTRGNFSVGFIALSFRVGTSAWQIYH